MTLPELNAATRDEFIATLGGIVEASPWIAERAWAHRPFASVERLHQAMAAAIDEANPDEQLAILRAHPDLGARVSMSAASTGEQSGVGLTTLAAAERARLLALTAEYRRRFGFPFLYAVKGSTIDTISAALDTRLTRPRDEEFAEALRQVQRIAWFRIEDAIA